MSNDAAIGYALIAAKRIGIAEEQTQRLIQAMYEAMDEHTEDEAEEAYAVT